ncbi:transposase [Rhizobium mesoamericanum]|nr:transposase [Rhizobium mesoamericanum]
MSEVCRSFGISHKTGYKIFNRDRGDGLEAPDGPVAATGALCNQ